jgi:hypothetical protein
MSCASEQEVDQREDVYNHRCLEVAKLKQCCQVLKHRHI